MGLGDLIGKVFKKAKGVVEATVGKVAHVASKVAHIGKQVIHGVQQGIQTVESIPIVGQFVSSAHKAADGFLKQSIGLTSGEAMGAASNILGTVEEVGNVAAGINEAAAQVTEQLSPAVAELQQTRGEDFERARTQLSAFGRNVIGATRDLREGNFSPASEAFQKAYQSIGNFNFTTPQALFESMQQRYTRNLIDTGNSLATQFGANPRGAFPLLNRLAPQRDLGNRVFPRLVKQFRPFAFSDAQFGIPETVQF